MIDFQKAKLGYPRTHNFVEEINFWKTEFWPLDQNYDVKWPRVILENFFITKIFLEKFQGNL